MKLSKSIRLLSVIGVLLLAACGKSHDNTSSVAPSPTPRSVTIAVASVKTLVPKEHLAGVIAPFQNVAISSDLTEPADVVQVQEGDTVHQGEVIAVLDTADLRAALNADLATAQSDNANTRHTVDQGGLTIAQGIDTYNSSRNTVEQAAATLHKDQLDLNRYQSLLRNGYISAQQVQTQQTLVMNDQKALQSSQASAASAKSAVNANGTLNSEGLQSTSVAQSRAQEQVALAQAQQERVMIEKAQIISPIDGVVVNRNLNPGEYPGTRQIFTLQQVDPVYVILHGSGAQIAQVKQNETASITSTDIHGVSLTGKVLGVLNEVNPGSTDFQVKIVAANPSRILRPGMAVEGDVALNPLNGVAIPTTAFTDDTQSSVMIVKADGVIGSMRVRAVGSSGNESIVTGLAPGARVVTDGQAGLTAGQKVVVK